MDPKDIAKLITEDPDVFCELRQPMVGYLKDTFPKVPDYVIKDFIYPIIKDDPKWAKEWKSTWLSDSTWKLETITVTLDIFIPRIRQKLKRRIEGENPDLVPRDAERHQKQKEIIKAGPSKEPIIMIKRNDGYELIEGWHRTIQSLLAWPEGYEQAAWVAYPSGE